MEALFQKRSGNGTGFVHEQLGLDAMNSRRLLQRLYNVHQEARFYFSGMRSAPAATVAAMACSASVVLARVRALGTFDPKVIYDQYNGRFIVVALEQAGSAVSDPSNLSRILLAVSDDSDPNGTWYYTSINSKVNIGGTEYWTDYPGIAMDANAVYVTGNLFPFASGGGQGSRVWIIDKNGWYTGGAPASGSMRSGTLPGLVERAMRILHPRK